MAAPVYTIFELAEYLRESAALNRQLGARFETAASFAAHEEQAADLLLPLAARLAELTINSVHRRDLTEIYGAVDELDATVDDLDYPELPQVRALLERVGAMLGALGPKPGTDRREIMEGMAREWRDVRMASAPTAIMNESFAEAFRSPSPLEVRFDQSEEPAAGPCPSCGDTGIIGHTGAECDCQRVACPYLGELNDG